MTANGGEIFPLPQCFGMNRTPLGGDSDKIIGQFTQPLFFTISGQTDAVSDGLLFQWRVILHQGNHSIHRVYSCRHILFDTAETQFGTTAYSRDSEFFFQKMNVLVAVAKNSRCKFNTVQFDGTFSQIDLTACALAVTGTERSRVDAAKSYIDQNYHNPNLNLDLVADHAGLSKYYLCKEFQHKFGVSPGKYIREVRLAKACRLLMTNTDYTMEQIAQQVGYSNNNYFGKVFRAEKGLPPDQYKKRSNRYDFVRAVYETPHEPPVPKGPAQASPVSARSTST